MQSDDNIPPKPLTAGKIKSGVLSILEMEVFECEVCLYNSCGFYSGS